MPDFSVPAEQLDGYLLQSGPEVGLYGLMRELRAVEFCSETGDELVLIALANTRVDGFTVMMFEGQDGLQGTVNIARSQGWPIRFAAIPTKRQVDVAQANTVCNGSGYELPEGFADFVEVLMASGVIEQYIRPVAIGFDPRDN